MQGLVWICDRRARSCSSRRYVARIRLRLTLSSTPAQVVVDTGTSLLSVAPDIRKELESRLDTSCANVNALPALGLVREDGAKLEVAPRGTEEMLRPGLPRSFGRA